MARVAVRGVRKYYGNVRALDGVDITFEDGEFVVLLGPSGCGKTTLLRCISGLEQLTEGEIYFDGREVSKLQPKDRNVSMVFQSYAVWPHMRVRDNIAYPLKLKGLQKEEIERKVRWAAELLNISELLGRYPSQLSGGQRQRVAVARAIVHKPNVLLMDEPLSNLDALLRVKMRSELKKLHEQLKVTTIYVTHDQVEAMTMGDRIAVMDRGRIVQFGRPEEIYKRPRTIFVAGFVGSPQMNFFDCEISDGGNSQFAVYGGIRFKLPLRTELRKVIVGLRPENVTLSSTGEECVRLRTRAYFVERLMPETVLHLEMLDAPERKILVAKLPHDFGIDEGQELECYVDPKHLHFFNPETQERMG